jgi:hypothetical protein
LTSAFTYTHNYTKEQDMDYPTWPYFYNDGAGLVAAAYHDLLEDFPVSGDDMARLKAGHRA